MGFSNLGAFLRINKQTIDDRITAIDQERAWWTEARHLSPAEETPEMTDLCARLRGEKTKLEKLSAEISKQLKIFIQNLSSATIEK